MIAIKGMTMPKSCIGCDLTAEIYAGAGVYECVLLQKRALGRKRRDECPPVEVKGEGEDGTGVNH